MNPEKKGFPIESKESIEIKIALMNALKKFHNAQLIIEGSPDNKTIKFRIVSK